MLKNENEMKYFEQALNGSFTDFQVTAHQLSNPDRDFTVNLFHHSINYVRQKLGEIVDISDVGYVEPTLHDIVDFANSITQKNLQVTISDIIMPTKRTVYIFKFVANFILFMEDKEKSSSLVFREHEEKFQEVCRLNTESMDLRETLNRKIVDKEVLKGKLPLAEKRSKELLTAINTALEKTSEPDTNKYQDKIAKLVERIEENTAKLSVYQRDYEEKMKTYMLVKNCEAFTEEINKLDIDTKNKSEELASISEALDNKQVNFEYFISLERTLKNLKEQRKLYNEKISAVTDSIKACTDESDIKKLNAQVASIKKKLQEADENDENQKRLMKENEEKLQQLKEVLVKLKVEISTHKEHHSKMNMQNDANIKKYKQKILQCMSLDKQIKDNNDIALRQYEKILSEFKKLQIMLFEKLDH